MASRASRLRIRPLAGAVVLVTFALAACQPYRDEIFLIVNETGENVVVTWSGGVYANLPPGRSTEAIPPPNRCRVTPLPDDRFTATTETGKRYTYGRPMCPGETWHIREKTPGSPPAPAGDRRTP